MNNNQKQQIISMRTQGLSYNEISDCLNISPNTISAFCKRNGIEKNTVLCKNCNTPITLVNGQKPKKFCSNHCRTAWWNAHQDEVNKKAVYTFTCANCGAEFTAYGNSTRKYCSHSCYIKSRYNKGGDSDE